MKRCVSSGAARAAGFSLIELMIALVVGLIVSGAVLAFTASSMQSNSDYMLSTRLTQELRNSMDLVTRDLRRAGYDEAALKYVATGNASPFSRMRLCNVSGACSTVSSAGVAAAAGTITCAIYAYDRAGGTDGVVDLGNGEVRGIRMMQRTVGGRIVGVLEYAVSTGTTEPTCSDASPDYTSYPATCNGAWCVLSDPAKLDITQFAITDNGNVVGNAPSQVQLRDLTINMTGRLAGASDFTRQLQSDVRIRSDCYDATISNCALAP